MLRTRIQRRTVILTILTLTLGGMMVGCSSSCVSCSSLRDPTIVDLRICTSTIPNPGEANRACEDLVVTIEGTNP